MFLSRENSLIMNSNESLSYMEQEERRFSDLQTNHDDNNEYGSLHYVESSTALAPITTKIRSSTLLTENIILEITKSIKIFKPSRSLYHLTKDSSHQNDELMSQNKPTASIDVVISGKDLLLI